MIYSDYAEGRHSLTLDCYIFAAISGFFLGVAIVGGERGGNIGRFAVIFDFILGMAMADIMYEYKMPQLSDCGLWL